MNSMCRLVASILMALLTAAASADETVPQLKARVDAASVGDRAQIYLRIAQLELKNADRLFDEGQSDQALAAVEDVAEYSEKARDAAKESKKHLKNVEIGARRMAEKLKDLKRSLAVEDHVPVEKVIQRLEDVRTALLKEMFKKEKK